MIETKVKKIIAEQDAIHAASIDTSKQLQDLGLDSLDAVEITMHLEEEFDVFINPDYMVDTVINDIIKQVGSLLDNQT